MNSNTPAGSIRTKIVLPIVALFAILLFGLTYMGIEKSRRDNLQLIRQQGSALLESLILSADNAIKAGSFFDLLVQEKFSDLSAFLEEDGKLKATSPELADFAADYGIDAILVFDSSMNLKASGARGVFVELTDIYGVVVPEIEALLADSSSRSSFQILGGDLPGDISLYYLTKSSDRKYIIAMVSDALFYSQAKENVGIGYLIQKIAREVGVEYIIFQSEDGIIFSSRKLQPILKIEKDSFLKEAIQADTVLSREQVFDDKRILELVKRFSSVEYPEGLFRLAISLEKYYDIAAGYDRQMIVLSLVLFAVLVLIVMYLSGKQKRIYLDRSFQHMKSLSEKVFDSINAGIIAVHRDGTIEMANRQLLNIFDIKEDNISGRAWKDFIFGNIPDFQKVLSGQAGPGEFEVIYTYSGGIKYLLINAGRLFDHRNEPADVVAVVYDYSKIKELEESSQRRERLTELGDLAAGVAHEIRNPLNAISIAAQRLLGEFEPKENAVEFRNFATQIKAEAGRLNEIVTRFLALARERRQAAGKIDISRVVEDAARLAALANQRDDIIMAIEIEPGVTGSIAEDRLKQMLINLINNAVQACEKKGGKVVIALKNKGGRAVLSVRDTGPGIPDNMRKKIFAPYFTTRRNGTGLGLSIVHQIVEEAGATIEILNPDGGGVEFRVTFRE
nr:PAS domain S-box protein [candidate division Zixibacteria bacterium]